MKKLLIIFLSIFALSLGGCLKDTPNVDFSNITPHAEFEFPGGAGGNGLGSGLEFFSGAALLFPPTDEADTLKFFVNIAAPNPLGKAVGITIGYDQAALDRYNADPNNTIKYNKMPDSCYSFLSTTPSVPANHYLTDSIAFIFYPSKFANLDQTQSWMVPISILDASGTAISSNFSTIWFHTIGNPLAGSYTSSGTRNNYTGTVSYTYPGAFPPPGSVVNLAFPALASPVTTSTISLPYSNLGSAGYAILITFDPVTFAITDVSQNQTFSDGVSAFKLHYANYDVPTKTFHIITQYNNNPAGGGNDRIVDQTYTKN
jgi:Domain of unknown function (DUF1735)